jgi:hypothetical protein
VDYLDVKARDMQEGNVTRRREIYNKHIRSLGFWDIIEGVTIRRLVLRRVGCTP